MADGAIKFGANLHTADGSDGPQISGPGYITPVLIQLQELKAMGVRAISVPVGYPVLDPDFQGGQAGLQPYLAFYTTLAQDIKSMGLKLVVDNEFLLSNNVETGWTNLLAFYSTLTWPEYMAGRAAQAALIAQSMRPDYLILANEPDNEANTTGQANMRNPADAALLVQAQISAVKALNLTDSPKLGAGIGSWAPASGPSCLTCFIDAYTPLPLDYIDIHIFPTNTEKGVSLIGNSLKIAQMAAAAGKPVTIGQAWNWKMEDSEWTVLTGNDYRARDPFSFWAPLDEYFLQTLQSLAKYIESPYVIPEGPDYLFAYQTFGGTAANGGIGNCTCTVESGSCDDYHVVHETDSLSMAANFAAEYTVTGVSYYHQLVEPPVTSPPEVPTGLTGKAGFTGSTLSWKSATDTGGPGIAGYNVFRCQGTALGGPCSSPYVHVANVTKTSYIDSGLTSNTPYNYQVQAFDLANNLSPLSSTLSLLTLRTSADAVTSVTAAAVSPKEIDISWSPPSDTNKLDKYIVYGGTSIAGLAELGATKTTTYRSMPLAAGTTYYYGVVAVEQGIDASISPYASATTLPLPNPPTTLRATTPTTKQIDLTWQENPAPGGLPIKNYQIYAGTVEGQLSPLATVSGTSHNAGGLSPATTYYIQIVAVDDDNDRSLPSKVWSVTTPPMPPPPANLQATAPSSTQITLSWQWSPLPNGFPISRYQGYCATSNPPALTSANHVGTVKAPATAMNWRSASPGTAYYCDVVAIDELGDESQPSSVVSIKMPS